MEQISILSPASHPGEHDVRWLTESAIVGVARAFDGKLELFVQGPPLSPSTSLVRDVLEHQVWFRQDQREPIAASRILLPAERHFVPIAAFLCTQLIHNGIEDDPPVGFKRTEPFLEMAIRRLRLSDEALIGLAGELVTLHALCQRSATPHVVSILEGWNGWRESLRDLTLSDVGVEIKTTLRPSSIHPIQGVHQIEVLTDEYGQQLEQAAFLVSIGIAWSIEEQDGLSISSLVSAILTRIEDAGRADYVPVFLSRVREYGASSDVGYDHSSMADLARFNRSFSLSFIRCYDLLDSALKLLRSSDLETFPHLLHHSVSYSLVLPERLVGDINPISGLHNVATALLRGKGA